MKIMYVLGFMLLASCSASPSNDYYRLSSPTGGQTPSDIMLTNVTIPEALDRPQIVLTSGANSIHILEYSRWAEPLDTMIKHVLSEDIGTPTTGGLQKITVSIAEFDADESGQVFLKASWEAQGHTRSTSPQHYVFEKSETASGNDMNAIVATMSKLLAELASDIVSHS